jgi:hypothetical protein
MIFEYKSSILTTTTVSATIPLVSLFGMSLPSLNLLFLDPRKITLRAADN